MRKKKTVAVPLLEMSTIHKLRNIRESDSRINTDGCEENWKKTMKVIDSVSSSSLYNECSGNPGVESWGIFLVYVKWGGGGGCS